MGRVAPQPSSLVPIDFPPSISSSRSIYGLTTTIDPAKIAGKVLALVSGDAASARLSACGDRRAPACSAARLWRGSQVVRPRSAKPLCAGSIPARASNYESTTYGGVPLKCHSLHYIKGVVRRRLGCWSVCRADPKFQRYPAKKIAALDPSFLERRAAALCG